MCTRPPVIEPLPRGRQHQKMTDYNLRSKSSSDDHKIHKVRKHKFTGRKLQSTHVVVFLTVQLTDTFTRLVGWSVGVLIGRLVGSHE